VTDKLAKILMICEWKETLNAAKKFLLMNLFS